MLFHVFKIGLIALCTQKGFDSIEKGTIDSSLELFVMKSLIGLDHRPGGADMSECIVRGNVYVKAGK